MAEPITLDQARAYLRVDDDTIDDGVTDAIVDARGWIEDYTGLILTRRTVVKPIEWFGAKLRAWPIVSIDSVDYTDSNGVAQVLSPETYAPQIAARPATLLAIGTTWPVFHCGTSVVVTMTAGFDGAEEINAFAPNLMRAMRLLIGGFYANRESGGLAGDVDTAARRLCRNLRSWTV